jgi:hypothetical protein
MAIKKLSIDTTLTQLSYHWTIPLNTPEAADRDTKVGKVTLKSNGDEALSNEFLLKSNGDEALNDVFSIKSNGDEAFNSKKKL